MIQTTKPYSTSKKSNLTSNILFTSCLDQIMYCNILIIFFILRNIFGQPQCESHSADFPSLFQNLNARIVNGFDTMEPLPYQLMLVEKVR